MILLDTCALVWLSDGGAVLSAKAKAALSANAGACYVSAISAFEVALLVERRRLTLPQPPANWFAAVLRFHGLQELPITGAIAATAVTLPPIHRDPADRFIIATALRHGLAVVTADATIGKYPGLRVIW